MSGHSILFLGHGESAADYLAELETLPSCTMLTRSAKLEMPQDAPGVIDIVLLEAGPMIAQTGKTLSALIHSLDAFPVVAVTQKANEHRGIAAVRAGAQAYICIDDVTVEGQEAIFDHAVKRHARGSVRPGVQIHEILNFYSAALLLVLRLAGRPRAAR